VPNPLRLRPPAGRHLRSIRAFTILLTENDTSAGDTGEPGGGGSSFEGRSAKRLTHLANQIPNQIPEHALVVATGVFDILHVGHLCFLEGARALGDELVVGVESDARVSGWKGPMRPVQSQDDRLALLAALRVVDRVFLIEGERTDPAYYAELLRPLGARFLAVTADDPYLAAKRSAMQSIGAELKIVTPRIENYSTSRLVRLLGLA
jgi:D-glycero-beta-D-manno-heptose 1-phosphate adenylyltransferase